MRATMTLLAACTLAAFAMPASAAISCADIPKAQDFVATLRPGPNTSAAQRHLDAAKRAASPQQCVAELRQVDTYARRSAAADKRMASRPSSRHVVQCADALHQNRPGGTDYHGPYVPGCARS
jgi:hypothetical protein